jgi:hypothetical protein
VASVVFARTTSPLGSVSNPVPFNTKALIDGDLDIVKIELDVDVLEFIRVVTII